MSFEAKENSSGVDSCWYAIPVRMTAERLAAEALSSRGITVFSPVYTTKRFWSDRAKDIEVPLFPGYVFCSLAASTRLTALAVPGSVRLGTGKSAPVLVDEMEVRAIQALIHEGLRLEPWPYLRQRGGNLVRIVSAGLRGVVGILVERRKLVVSISALHRSVAIDLSDEREIEVAAVTAFGA
jgi:transcription antitermination factor NusG